MKLVWRREFYGDEPAMERVAIFGGTFNPVHCGHLLIAEAATTQFVLDQVVWVPTYQPPHKTQELATFEQRCTMVMLAIADYPHFVWSPIEAQQPGVSYAIDTLSALQTQYPPVQWFWIIGADAFRKLPRWRQSQELMARCFWIVAPRDSASATDLDVADSPAQWQWLQMPACAIASSLVRQACRERRSLHSFVPTAVETYIQQQQLYFQPNHG